MSDLIERLRRIENDQNYCCSRNCMAAPDIGDAADEIERLTTKLEEETKMSEEEPALTQDLIRKLVENLNEQEVPSPYIVYSNGYFYEIGVDGNKFSRYGYYWSEWDSDHPACKWWEDNIR